MKRSCHICNQPLHRKKVHTGYTWMHKDDSKCCDLCLKPLELIRLGKNKFPIWVHTGEALRDCKALRTSYNFAKTLRRRLDGFKRHLRYEMVGDRVRRFRETRD